MPPGIPWPRWAQGYGLLTRKTVLVRGISFSIFLRRRVVQAVGRFDESLGAGAAWNWGEESDYLFRAVETGFHIYDLEDLLVFHDNPEVSNAPNPAKEYSQALGMGHFLRTHRVPLGDASRYLLAPLRVSVRSLLAGERHLARRCWRVFRGRIVGYCSRC